MVNVIYEGIHVSTVNYGWEDPAFYHEWMGSDESVREAELMSGASIDVSSQDRVDPEEVLEMFEGMLDEIWIEKFKPHYSAVKTAVADKPYRLRPSLGSKKSSAAPVASKAAGPPRRTQKMRLSHREVQR